MRGSSKTVVLTERELDDLGLGAQRKQTIADRLKRVTDLFDQAKKSQDKIGTTTKWIDFGALRPGTIPAGTNGATKDVTVYENVVAMVETAGKPVQIPIGTMIKVKDGWRIIDLPLASAEGGTQFVFFEASQQPMSPGGSSGYRYADASAGRITASD